MEWVQRALERGLLDIEMVNEDIRAGLVRPSLRQDVESLTREQALPVLPDTTPDAVFVPPELRLTDEQFLLLHSRALQERTIRFGKQRKGTGKAEKGGTGKGRLKSIRRSLRFVRRLPQLGLRAAYLVYSVTARPAVTRLRARSRAKS